MSEIKLIPVEDFKDFVHISRNAYPRMKVNTNEEIEKAVERFSKIQSENPKRNFYGLYRDNKLLGGMMLHDFVMNFSFKRIDAGGIGFVGVDIIHKKEKVAKELVTYYLNHYKNRGIYMALLYPFRPDFYKKMGFGFGTKNNEYKIKPNLLPKGNSKSNVSFIGEDDKTELLGCYNRYLEKTHGMMEKSDPEVDGIFKNSENRVIAYKKDGKILGYIVFTFKMDERESFLENDIQIKELIYENSQALLELMTFLHTQNDQIRYIILNTQDEYFHHILSNPVNGTNNIIPSVYHESNTQGVGLMYRVIDVKGMFRTLKDHNFGYETCKIKLNITDSFMLENNDSFILHIHNGNAQVEEKGEYDVEVSMDISDFSSLLVGTVNFKALYRYGLASISDIDYINVVDRAFYMPDKPICITPF